jgi:tRNA A-37 threonylcarbamoyl transferase component Bud32
MFHTHIQPAKTMPMTQLKRCRSGSSLIWFDPVLIDQPDPAIFSVDYWRYRQAILGSASGRHEVWFVKQQEQALVLRHYYRGGLIGKLIRDTFLRVNARRCRGLAEFSLLQQLYSRGLPVPRPAAARIRTLGLIYQADILIQLIPNSQDLAQLLQQRALTSQEWFVIGQTLRRFHDEGVYHADLNCHNLLLDTAGRAWLVDFDRGRFRPEGIWKNDNLDRLLRSFRKELRRLKPFYWKETDWERMLRGYRA